VQHFYIPPLSFKSFGSWTLNGDYMTGRTDGTGGTNGVPAIAEVDITKAGNYRLWVRDRDYATNQPGKRSFHASVDGVMAGEKLGDHGMEGFRWSQVGVYPLNAGVHELALWDTSGFYARSEGFLLTEVSVTIHPPASFE